MKSVHSSPSLFLSLRMWHTFLLLSDTAAFTRSLVRFINWLMFLAPFHSLAPPVSSSAIPPGRGGAEVKMMRMIKTLRVAMKCFASSCLCDNTILSFSARNSSVKGTFSLSLPLSLSPHRVRVSVRFDLPHSASALKKRGGRRRRRRNSVRREAVREKDELPATVHLSWWALVELMTLLSLYTTSISPWEFSMTDAFAREEENGHISLFVPDDATILFSPTRSSCRSYSLSLALSVFFSSSLCDQIKTRTGVHCFIHNTLFIQLLILLLAALPTFLFSSSLSISIFSLLSPSHTHLDVLAFQPQRMTARRTEITTLVRRSREKSNKQCNVATFLYPHPN